MEKLHWGAKIGEIAIGGLLPPISPRYDPQDYKQNELFLVIAGPVGDFRDRL